MQDKIKWEERHTETSIRNQHTEITYTEALGMAEIDGRIKQMAEEAKVPTHISAHPAFKQFTHLFAKAIAEDCARIASDAVRYNMEWMQNDGPYMTAQNDGPYVERDDVIEAIRARYGIKR